jgi:hypothetical protein
MDTALSRPVSLLSWTSACRAAERAKNEQSVANDVPGRKGFAKKLEEQFLRKSMDARVSTEGDKGTILRVKYIGFTRPSVFQLQESPSKA